MPLANLRQRPAAPALRVGTRDPSMTSEATVRSRGGRGPEEGATKRRDYLMMLPAARGRPADAPDAMPVAALLVAQRLNRIDPARAVRGNHAGGSRDQGQQQHRGSGDPRVRRLDAV